MTTLHLEGDRVLSQVDGESVTDSSEVNGRADDRLNRAEKIALSAAVAPLLRQQSQSATRRRVARVDKDGNVVGYTTIAEVQRALLAKYALEIELGDGLYQRSAFCTDCGLPVERRSPSHKTICNGCRKVDHACAGHRGFECPRVPPSTAFSPERVRRRKGEPWRCISCSRASALEARVLIPRCAGVPREPCEKSAPQKALQPWAVRSRDGQPWRCGSCATKMQHRRALERKP